jgi:hypothetical protein
MPNRDIVYHAEKLFSVFRNSVQRRDNEAGLRFDVEQTIRDALSDLYDISLNQIVVERQNAAGRLDVRYGGVIAEYAWNMRTTGNRRHEAQQALDYLQAERERIGDHEIFSAVVTDGVVFGFLIADSDVGAQLDLLGGEPVTSDQKFVWQPNSEAACRRFLELIGSNPQAPVTGHALTAALGRGSATARRLISLFVQDIYNRQPNDRTDTMFREWRRALDVAYGSLDRDDAELLHDLRRDYELVGQGSLGAFLFSLHTYFALASRLVAVEILSISVGDQLSRPSTWVGLPDEQLAHKLTQLEHGTIPQGLVVSNLLEGDVFSWYLERLAGNVTLLNSVRLVCENLGRFAFPRLAYGHAPTIDLLRDVYQGLTTRELRKSLGEFLTPSWLAECTLEAATRNGANLRSGRVLDCTCGTGTFLSPILRTRIRELRVRTENAPTVNEIQEVLNSVVGIDINPVAVTATRLNYLIALGDLAAVGEIYLPVWLADSVLLPDGRPVQADFGRYPELAGRDFVELSTSLDEPFVIPVQVVAQDALARLSTALQRGIDANHNIDEFAHSLAAEMGPDSAHPVTATAETWSDALAVSRVLYRQLQKLHNEGRDGVWAEIIENRFAPLFIGKFDMVVGNPPWLTWTKLPATWRQAAQPIWRDYGLFDIPVIPGVATSVSLQTSDIATLVTAVAIERYLAEGGILAYVAPKSLINGDPANRAFRLYHLESARDAQARRRIDVTYSLREVQDFSEVQPFAPDASNSPIVVVIQKGTPTGFPTQGTRWSRRVANTSIPDGTWDQARARLSEEQISWFPISRYPASPLAWWRVEETPLQGDLSPYMFGVGFHTRGANGIFFLDLRGQTQQNGQIRVATIPDRGRDEELINRGPQTGLVESVLVVPAVRGRDVQPYSVRPSSHILLAHDPQNRARPLTEHEMRTTYRGALQLLRTFREKLLARAPYLGFRPREDLWWHLLDTEHMDGPAHFVCVREQPGGAHAAMAGVISDVWDDRLGRTATPVFDHKVIFYRTVNSAEAYYLAGMINSAAIRVILERFANFISVSPQTLRYLPIPRFDSTEPLYMEIADQSREAHIQNGGAREAAIAAVDEAVLRLLRY